VKKSVAVLDIGEFCSAASLDAASTHAADALILMRSAGTHNDMLVTTTRANQQRALRTGV
jgi:hypothetical protein